MECNKDEAFRARSIAEKKMECNDYEGARKIVLKAQSLYPELDNINQLLSICDVHCSAQKRLGSEKDWYGILQVEKLADELKVKKQYRRLALSLHPDKNRFPGAEGAFKLICEANTVLSDPAKKSLYDSKIRFLVKSGPVIPPSSHTSQFNNRNSARSSVSNGFNRQNQHQATQSTSSVKQEVFWTICPYCDVRYQYLREFVMRSLRCQQCLKVFVAHDIGTQSASMDSKLGQSSAPREKVAPSQADSKTGIQNDKGPSASHAGSSQRTTNRKNVKSKLGTQTGCGSEGIHVVSRPNINEDLKSKDKENAKSCGVKQGGVSNGDANKRKTSDVKNRRKRGRQVVEESSESLDSSNESKEDVTITGKFGDGATNMKSGSCHVQSPRRSSRKRKRVIYDETDEDGFASHKKAKKNKGSKEKAQKDALDNEDTKPETQDSFSNDADLPNSKQMGNVRSKESLQKRDTGCDEEVKLSGATDVKSYTAADTHDTETDPNIDLSPDDTGAVSYCPDPEFSDFDRERDESRFAVNQFWACYDTLDGMPRFYAKVKKVCYNPFNLVITWLEAVPIDNGFGEWVAKELPVGCGTFKFGQTEETSIRLSFSHQVLCERGKKKGSFVIYPRDGEVWAVFKDWNISWASDPENHKEEFKYAIVEVLSNFIPGTGIKVCYLDKVGGFISLFQRSGQGEDNSFLIGADELYKFSHPVPCFKMTGTERDGVPVGSFELDPAALPMKPEDVYYPSKAKMEQKNTVCGPDFSIKEGKPTESRGKSTLKRSTEAKGGTGGYACTP